MKKEGWNGKNPAGLLDCFPLFIRGVLLGKRRGEEEQGGWGRQREGKGLIEKRRGIKWGSKGLLRGGPRRSPVLLQTPRSNILTGSVQVLGLYVERRGRDRKGKGGDKRGGKRMVQGWGCECRGVSEPSLLCVIFLFNLFFNCCYDLI